MKDAEQIQAELAEPFHPDDIKWLPKVVKGDKALGMPYVDARAVMDRLDEVFGPGGWQDEYSVLNDGCVVCTLRVRIGGEWVHKQDVGNPSEQPDGGDRLKAAFSDGLKRAAVKLGIGRGLYRIPPQWADFDPVKKQFKQKPQLPAWASPKPAARQAPAPQPAKAAPADLPRTGAELNDRLWKFDAKLAGEGRAVQGGLVEYVLAELKRAGFGDSLQKCEGPAIPFAAGAAKQFANAHPARKAG